MYYNNGIELNEDNRDNNIVIAITHVLSPYNKHHKMVAYVDSHKTNSVIIARVYITEAIHKPTEAERRF